MGDLQTQMVIEVEPSELKLVDSLSLENGVQVERLAHEGLEPVTTVVLVLMGASLAVGQVVYLLEKRKGGQVFDLRPHADRQFYRTPDLQYGLVAIMAADGSLEVEVKEPKGMFGIVVESIVSILPKLGSAPVQEMKNAIQDELGSKATVSQAA